MTSGAYKAHFNEDGTGKGKLDDDSDKVWDLSDITRPNLAKKADIDQRVARNERLEARARSAFKKYGSCVCVAACGAGTSPQWALLFHIAQV